MASITDNDATWNIRPGNVDPMHSMDYKSWCGEIVIAMPYWVCSRKIGHVGHHVASAGVRSPCRYVKYRCLPGQELPEGF